jgi:hypothetical protein
MLNQLVASLNPTLAIIIVCMTETLWHSII